MPRPIRIRKLVVEAYVKEAMVVRKEVDRKSMMGTACGNYRARIARQHIMTSLTLARLAKMHKYSHRLWLRIVLAS